MRRNSLITTQANKTIRGKIDLLRGKVREAKQLLTNSRTKGKTIASEKVAAVKATAEAAASSGAIRSDYLPLHNLL